VHEKEARLLVEHVAVDGRYLDTVFAQRAIIAFTSSAVTTKSPVIAAFQLPRLGVS
jgi:hypothetical protein